MQPIVRAGVELMETSLSEHLEALRRWVDGLGRLQGRPSSLSSEERKQLQAVSKAVEQLNRSQTSVPEDLRRLKLRLSAKESTGREHRAAEADIKELDAVIETLAVVLKSARSAKERLKNAVRSGGAKKRYGVTLVDLMEAASLSPEDKLQLQWLKDGPRFEGKVKSDGTILVKLADGWKAFDSLSTAASKVAGQSLNGWKHWCRLNRDGSSISLDDIRRRYLDEEAGR